jgi:hypothetical protein
MMKKFISNIILFVFIGTILVVSFATMVYLLQLKASFKLPSNKHILVIGDSHTELAIDDNIFSQAVNVSQGATIFLYSYCKIKRFLNENSHIDTVLLSFHYEPITHTVYNRWINMFTFDKLPHQLTLLNKEDICILANKKTTFINAILHSPYRIIFKFLIKGSLSYEDLEIGAYQKNNSYNLSKDITYQNKQTKQPEEETSISLCQKEYLLKITDLCKSRNVKLVLINTPVYKPDVYGNIDKLNNFYNTYLSGVKYMDYSAFPLPDSCYRDVGHLNYKGAEIFSKYLQKNFNTDTKLR